MKYVAMIKVENGSVFAIGDDSLQNVVDKAKEFVSSAEDGKVIVYKEHYEVTEVPATKIKISKLGE